MDISWNALELLAYLVGIEESLDEWFIGKDVILSYGGF